MTTIEQATKAAQVVRRFMPWHQLETVGDFCRGQEAEFFRAKLVELAERFSTMPATYEQDGKGADAIAYLHYFSASGDWYITEKDCEPEQHQAFGWADLGYGGELGYISLTEFCSSARVELDLHFEPTRLGDVIAQRDRPATNRPGDEAAVMHEETGIDYERCLVLCNMD